MATNNAVNSPLSGTTGTGNFVGSNTPTITTPVINDSNANNICTFSGVASAVDYFTITNSTTSSAISSPTIGVAGSDSYININFQNKGIGAYQFFATSTTPTIIRWYEQTTNGTSYIGLKAPTSLSGNQEWQLPAIDGSNGYPLTTNGSSVLSFSNPISGAALPTGSMFNFQQTQLTTTVSVTPAGVFTAVSGMSVTITPTSSSNQVLVRAVMNVGISNNTNIVMFQLARLPSTAIGIGTGVLGSRQAITSGLYSSGATGNDMYTVVCEWLDSPATTSATTYIVQAFCLAGTTIYLNRNGTDTNTSAYGRSVSVFSTCEVKV